MRKLLWVGDSPDCPSGFARATREVLDVARQKFDVTVLGINYRGDPGGQTFGYPVYVAAVGGDWMGVKRLLDMCDLVKPDVIVIQQDPWNIPLYLKHLRSRAEYAHLPVVGFIAVDGKNCPGKDLNGLSLAVFWTEFGRTEAHKGGHTGPSAVVPLGVDTSIYKPMPRKEARIRRGLPKDTLDYFIVGNVNRNPPRKRWDLSVRYFAEWITSREIVDAYLFLHTAPTGDMGPNIEQLATYYGILERLMLVEQGVFTGISEESMADTYNCFDIDITTSQGEGFGLTTLEAMACGVPCIVPDWAALGEWPGDSVIRVPCTSTAINPVLPGVNIIGGVADQQLFIQALDNLYYSKTLRTSLGAAGLVKANEACYRWPAIGEAFTSLLEQTLDPDNAIAWADLGRPQEVAS